MEKIRGVNLGGWFVLEKWMKPTLFDGLKALDETGFVKEHPAAHETLESHWKSFISEEDIIYLGTLGINSVRIPVPWWLFDNPPYFSPLPYLDQVMEWCEKHQMAVLIDLHTAPGCQNGFDNGGIKGQIGWHLEKVNLSTTVDVLGKIAKRYRTNKYLWGIEVLNEPHWTIPMDLLQTFYKEAYLEIRKFSKACVVFHDGFRPEDTSWEPFFKDQTFENIAFDLHFYSCFGSFFEKLPLPEILNFTLTKRSEIIKRLVPIVRVIVGEWSLGLHEFLFEGMDKFSRDSALRTYANAQLTVYEQGFGWYFWNYLIDDNKMNNWSFKHLVTEHIMPSIYGNKKG